MAASSIAFWRRVALAAIVAITLLVVIPSVIPKYLHSADKAQYLLS